MTRVYVGLGANLGDREAALRGAVERLAAELRLKKEYSAVYSLFRYCVLTADATYLCNTLDLKYVPQPSYPFFHLKMEDVWVWDKNLFFNDTATTEIYTSSDVTVEELRGEGDETKLTAEALAEKIGESLSSDDDYAP